MEIWFIAIILFTLTYNDCSYGFELLNQTIDNQWITDSLNNVTTKIEKNLPFELRAKFPIIPHDKYDSIAKYMVSLYNFSLKNNPEATKNIVELLESNGFNVEEHQVETEDGYVLGMFRIPGDGATIFLMHGLMLSADDWVTAGRETGLAYLLAERGFDVWLGNNRGTKHSRRHNKLSPESEKFWDFSFYEVGIYDVPSMIDYILDVTNTSQLIYVAHSQGCTAFFVMCSEKLEYNSKISLMIALAPVAAVPHIKTPLLLLVNTLTQHRPEYLFTALRNMGYNDFLSGAGLVRFATIAFCGNRVLQPICNKVLYVGAGFDYSQINYTTLGTVYAHIPAGASTKQLEHYAQSIRHGKFCQFDHGKQKNMIKYGSETPPEFRIENITTPIAIFYGRNDWVATVEDVFALRRRLLNVVKTYEVPYQKFSHLDFVYAKDFKTLVFSELLKLITEV